MRRNESNQINKIGFVGSFRCQNTGFRFFTEYTYGRRSFSMLQTMNEKEITELE